MIPKHIQVKKSIKNDRAGFVEAIPAIVFAVIISYVYLNVGTFMNGTLGSELSEGFTKVPNDNSSLPNHYTRIQNDSRGTMDNLSGYYDDNVAIIKIAITIAVLLVPIAAVMTLRRFT